MLDTHNAGKEKEAKVLNKKGNMTEDDQHGKGMLIHETLMDSYLILVKCTKLNTYVKGKEVNKVKKKNVGSRVDRGIIIKSSLKDCTNVMSMGDGIENEVIQKIAKGQWKFKARLKGTCDRQQELRAKEV